MLNPSSSGIRKEKDRKKKKTGFSSCSAKHGSMQHLFVVTSDDGRFRRGSFGGLIGWLVCWWTKVKFPRRGWEFLYFIVFIFI